MPRHSRKVSADQNSLASIQTLTEKASSAYKDHDQPNAEKRIGNFERFMKTKGGKNSEAMMGYALNYLDRLAVTNS